MKANPLKKWQKIWYASLIIYIVTPLIGIAYFVSLAVLNGRGDGEGWTIFFIAAFWHPLALAMTIINGIAIRKSKSVKVPNSHMERLVKWPALGQLLILPAIFLMLVLAFAITSVQCINAGVKIYCQLEPMIEYIAITFFIAVVMYIIVIVKSSSLIKEIKYPGSTQREMKFRKSSAVPVRPNKNRDT